LLDLLGHS